MPINKKAKVGKKQITAVEFGTGDINVWVCNHGIALQQSNPKEINLTVIDPNVTLGHSGLEALVGDVVYLKFNKIESVDVVIDQLNELRKNLVFQSSPPQ